MNGIAQHLRLLVECGRDWGRKTCSSVGREDEASRDRDCQDDDGRSARCECAGRTTVSRDRSGGWCETVIKTQKDAVIRALGRSFLFDAVIALVPILFNLLGVVTACGPLKACSRVRLGDLGAGVLWELQRV
jgi:hypothetical protein